ncbi:MAG: hypothetical protein ACRC8J_06385 [Phocaeicola sp.]
MKLLIRNTITILLTLLVAYGGAGVNLLTYCCNDCRSEGLSIILEEKCHDVHGHSTSDAIAQSKSQPSCEMNCCKSQEENSMQSTDEESCDINRIDTKWEIAHNIQFDLDPLTINLPPFLTAQQITLEDPTVEKINSVYCNHGPPVHSPRTYLALLTTLLI